MRARLAAVLLPMLLAACEVGPDYVRPPPASATPAAFKEVPDGWKVAQPNDAMRRGSWWSIYNDPVLDDLEKQVNVSNQTVKVSEASFRQASAIIREARAQLFPVITGSAAVTRSQQGAGSIGTGTVSTGAGEPHTRYSFAGAVSSWEIDLWGQIRRQVESDVATAQATAGDLASAQLSAQAQLATAYFELRIDDELRRLLDATVEAFGRSLQITQNKYRAGTAARSDVAQAQTQLDTTRAQLIAVGVTRAQFEHAIAVLIGKSPAEFSIAPVVLNTGVPVVPPGMPSALLERRPDIAAAERRIASANAQIGVAISGYYPNLTLNGTYGWQGNALDQQFAPSSRVWSIGASLAQTFFDGGSRHAQVDAARAFYDGSVANYRQTVLIAFQQVEDNLAQLRILEQEASVQASAVQSAELAERLILNQYLAGTVDYTTVITAQTAALSNEQTALTITQNRLVASVALVQALGGGWDASQIPPNGDEREVNIAPTEDARPTWVRWVSKVLPWW
jgi:NodT family efflux transporter outer membrane factor (OMF) lipoprotein